VAGPLDPDNGGVGSQPGQLLDVLRVHHRAPCLTVDQREWGGGCTQDVPESVSLGSGEVAFGASLMTPDPRPVTSLQRVVQDSSTQCRFTALGMVSHRARDQCFKVGKGGGTVHEIEYCFGLVVVDGGGDVEQHQVTHHVRPLGENFNGHESPQRHTNERNGAGGEFVHHHGNISCVSGDGRVGIGRRIGVAVTRQINRHQRSLESQGHGVERVGVLRSTVEQHEFGLTLTPDQATDLAKSIYADKESSHGWDGHVESPLRQVLVKEAKFVVGESHPRERSDTAKEVAMSAQLFALILAAGEGTRMGSDRPKSLLDVGGRAMIEWVLDAVPTEHLGGVVVVAGKGLDEMRRALQGRHVGSVPVTVVEQRERLGTGHAVRVALSALDQAMSEDDHVLVLLGDAPLITRHSLAALLREHERSGATLSVVSALVDNPTGYGRCVLHERTLVAIVEERDATPAQKTLREINTGAMVARAGALRSAVARLVPHADSGEYYVTDVVADLVGGGALVRAWCLDSADEGEGVNTPDQLARAAATLRRRENVR
jgi:CTP:molybdopterin cytidylyltransferase MocA